MTPKYDDHPNGKPDPACLLAVHELVEATAERTAAKVEKALEPLFLRMARLEAKVIGNGVPGLAEQVRVLQQQHEDMKREHVDAVRLRRQIWLVVAGHAVAIIAAIIWAAQWVAKVEAFMGQEAEVYTSSPHASHP